MNIDPEPQGLKRFSDCSANCALTARCDGSCMSDFGEPHAPKIPNGSKIEWPQILGELQRPTVSGPGLKDTNPKDAIGDTKVPLWLLSPVAKAHWAAAQFSGMVKYGAWNWRAAGVRTSIYLSAMARHMDAYLDGEDRDPIDGTKHLANIMACAAILLDAEAKGKLKDDRPPRQDSMREAYADVERLMVRLRDQYKDRHPHHYTQAEPEVKP